jgi:hypothetical protein
MGGDIISALMSLSWKKTFYVANADEVANAVVIVLIFNKAAIENNFILPLAVTREEDEINP